jgi:class 3 adenylate cyclase
VVQLALFLFFLCIPGFSDPEQSAGRFAVTQKNLSLDGIRIAPAAYSPENPEILEGIQVVDGLPALSLESFFQLGVLHFTQPLDLEVAGIQMKIWIDPQDPPQGVRKLQYSAGPKRVDIHRYHSFHSLPRGVWTTWTLWLSFPDKEEDFKLYSKWSAPQKFEGVRVLPGTGGTVYIHSLARIVPPLMPTDALQSARKRFPSLFAKPWSLSLLCIILTLFILCILAGSRRKISLFFLGSFLLPAIGILVFLGIVGQSTLQNMEEARIYKAKRSMVRQFRRILKLQDSIEQKFQSELRKFQQEILSFVKSRRSQGEGFERNSFDKEFSVYSTKGRIPLNQIHSIDPFDQFLSAKLAETGLEILVTNGKAIWYSLRDSAHITKGAYAKVLHNLLYRNFDPESAGKFQSAFRSSQEAVLEMRKLFLVGDNLRDDFLNNPARLYQINITESPYPWIEARDFWTFLLEPESGFPWLSLGVIRSDTLTVFLEQEYRQNSLLRSLDDEFNTPLDYFVSGFSSQRFFPQEYDNSEMFSLLSQKARVTQKLIFQSVFQDDHLYFYLSGPVEKQPQVALTLRIQGDEIYRSLQKDQNRLYFGALFLLAVLLGICLPFSFSVTRPILKISRVLKRVRAGDLSQDLVVRGYDQFASAASHFNGLIEQLREKERLSKFLSQIALRSLESGEREATRQTVGILFCGIRNLDEPSHQSYSLRLDMIRQFLQLFEQVLAQSEGMLDKFTGHAAIALFTGEDSVSQMLDTCIELRSKVLDQNENTTPGQFHHLELGIGIATGPVVLGPVGPDLRKDYTAIGATVNMAARLHGLGDSSKEVTIHLDTPSRSAIKHIKKYEIAERQDVAIKGLQKKQTVYEIL